MDIERPDTTPGFEMESPNFNLSFVTGLQRGVASSMLEMETDWYDKLLLNLAIQPLKFATFYRILVTLHADTDIYLLFIAEIHVSAQV